MGQLSVANFDDEVGPLRAHWGIRLFSEYDSLPEPCMWLAGMKSYSRRLRSTNIDTSLGITEFGARRPEPPLASTQKPSATLKDSQGLNAPLTAIAAFCEGVLLGSSFADVAYARYAVEATYATTNLTTFKAIVKKYPHMPRESILRDLVASQPGNEGKSFAAAKDAAFFELAIELANRSPSDPRTLIRAARDYAAKRPEFALAAGMTVLRGIANRWGYDVTSIDVLDAYAAVMAAACAAGVDEAVVRADVRALMAASSGAGVR